jgi:hypothetical protein
MGRGKLTNDELNALVIRIKAEKDHRKRQWLFSDLVEACKPLLRNAAAKNRRSRFVDKAEIESQAYQSLTDAVEAYDQSRGDFDRFYRFVAKRRQISVYSAAWREIHQIPTLSVDVENDNGQKWIDVIADPTVKHIYRNDYDGHEELKALWGELKKKLSESELLAVIHVLSRGDTYLEAEKRFGKIKSERGPSVVRRTKRQKYKLIDNALQRARRKAKAIIDRLDAIQKRENQVDN